MHWLYAKTDKFSFFFFFIINTECLLLFISLLLIYISLTSDLFNFCWLFYSNIIANLTFTLLLLFFSGNSLIKCGQTQMQIGNAEKEFVQSACNNFLQPLKNFLEGDMRTIQVGIVIFSHFNSFGDLNYLFFTLFS